MSASERLKALEKTRLDNPTTLSSIDAEAAVLAALPQILAVVEAAEETLRLHDAHPTVNNMSGSKTRAALAALEEALK